MVGDFFCLVLLFLAGAGVIEPCPPTKRWSKCLCFRPTQHMMTGVDKRAWPEPSPARVGLLTDRKAAVLHDAVPVED